MNIGIMTPAWGVYCTLDERERERDRGKGREGKRQTLSQVNGASRPHLLPPRPPTPAHATSTSTLTTFPTCSLILETVVVVVVQ